MQSIPTKIPTETKKRARSVTPEPSAEANSTPPRQVRTLRIPVAKLQVPLTPIRQAELKLPRIGNLFHEGFIPEEALFPRN